MRARAAGAGGKESERDGRSRGKPAAPLARASVQISSDLFVVACVSRVRACSERSPSRCVLLTFSSACLFSRACVPAPRHFSRCVAFLVLPRIGPRVSRKCDEGGRERERDRVFSSRVASSERAEECVPRRSAVSFLSDNRRDKREEVFV